MHTLIVGERRVGKSTLIGRVLNALDRPVYGFEKVLRLRFRSVYKELHADHETGC